MSFEEQNDLNSNIARRVKANRMRRKVRKTKMIFSRIRALFRFLTIIFLCFLTFKALKLSKWYLSAKVFDAPSSKYLKIEGNKIVPDYKILEVLRRTDLPQTPIYLLDTHEMEQNISKLTPVKRVFIRRFWWPARLLVKIEERAPIISISPSESVEPIAFFTSCGKLIGSDYLPLDKSFETYLVLSYGTRGDDYRNWDMDRINLIAYLAKELERLSGEKVVYLDFRNPKDVYAKLDSALIRLGELSDATFGKISNIGSILQKIKTLENQKVKYIDARWDTSYLKLDNSSKDEPVFEQNQEQNQNPGQEPASANAGERESQSRQHKTNHAPEHSTESSTPVGVN